MQIFPLGGWLVSALSISIEENGSNPLFNLNHKHKNDLMLALFIFSTGNYLSFFF